jgi:predicted Zn-dependent peptidase
MRTFSFLLFLASSLALCPAMSDKAFAQKSDLAQTRPLIKTKPVPLNWRTIRWPTLQVFHAPLEGGASFYSIPSDSARKFKLSLVFSHGVYTRPQRDRVALGAAVDMFLLGGAGQRSYEDLQRYLAEKGIQINTNVTSLGDVSFSVEGLKEDLPIALGVLEDVLLRPRFDKPALAIWKQENVDSFEDLLDASNSRKQNRFIQEEFVRLSLGEDHYFATSLQRSSKKAIEAVQHSEVVNIGKSVINRADLKVLITGSYEKKDEETLKKLVLKLPRTIPAVREWLPERSQAPTSKKLRIRIIQKADMTQASITYGYVFPDMGELNPIERTRLDILQEVYSASGGVVGNDRFSKAMRADSGISYSPYSFFDSDLVSPNTNVTAWKMVFQSANEKIPEAIRIAKKTWTDFVTQGITAEELENARIALMNGKLASEQTIFDKSEMFLSTLARRRLFNPNYMELQLLALEKEINVQAFNASLKDIAERNAIPAMVIMGNPSPEALKELSSQADIELLKTIPFDEVVKNLR